MTIFMRIRLWLRTIYFFVLSIGKNRNARFYTVEESINYVINNNASLIRFGDGEFNIMDGRSIVYQVFSSELSNNLQTIINEYIKGSPENNYLLCMPRDFLDNNGIKLLKKRTYLSSWSYSRYIFKKKYDKNVIYGDAFAFSDIYEDIYMRLWIEKDLESVIFVHNNIKYCESFKQKYGLECDFVKVPDFNSYEVKEEILQEILTCAKKLNRFIVLISAGPCAKYLTFELSKKGIIAIDTGHCWDDPLII